MDSSDSDQELKILDNEQFTSITQEQYQETISSFQTLYWISYPAMLFLTWNLFLPFCILPGSKQQRDVGVSSVLCIILSTATFVWAYKNYKMLKEDSDKPKKHKISIFDLKTDGFIYCLCFFSIAFLSAFIIGFIFNYSNEKYLLQAKYLVSESEANTYIQAFLGLEAFVAFVIIVIFFIITKYTYYLEQEIENRTITLGNLMSLYLFTFTFYLFWQNADSLKRVEGSQVVTIRTNLYQLRALSLINIIVTIGFMFENRSIAQKRKVKKANFYYFPMFYYILSGFFLICIAYNFVSTEQNSFYNNKKCILAVQQYPMKFLDTLSCPKFLYKFYDESQPFNLNCEVKTLGIFWEQDEKTPNSKKINQIGCLRKQCCKLLDQGYSFWDNHIMSYVLLNAFMGFIIAYHCYDLGCHDPIKLTSKFTYTGCKIAVQIMVPLLFIIAMFVFVTISPDNRPIDLSKFKRPAKSLIQNQLLNFNINYFSGYNNCKQINYTIQNTECQNLQVCFESSQSIVISQSFNTDKVQIANPQNYYYGNTENKLCLKGNPSSIQSALKIYIAECTINSQTQTLKALETCESSSQKNTRILTESQTQNSYNGLTQNFKILSADTGLPLENAKIFAVSNKNQCNREDLRNSPKIREATTNENGEATLYNVPSESDIYVDLAGYYQRCLVFSQSNNTQIISLAKNLQNQQLYKIVLSAQNSSHNLNLGLTFDYGATHQCQVGTINRECGFANYTIKKKETVNEKIQGENDQIYRYQAKDEMPDYSQEIVIYQLLKVKYLIYIYPLFSSGILRQKYYQDLKPLSQNVSNSLQNYWNTINSVKATLQIYSNTTDTPILNQQIQFPQMEGRNLYMALCFDGATFQITSLNRVFQQEKGFFPDAEQNCQ